LWKRRNIAYISFTQAYYFRGHLAKFYLLLYILNYKAIVVFIFYQNNYLVFMAELFWWFEVVKPPFVEPQVLDIEGKLIL